jgi:NAD(P)-dependent dehydrogenase (short-subunit alcohol dehydrogenase family)
MNAMAILSIRGSQPPYRRHALKCEVFAHKRFGKPEEVCSGGFLASEDGSYITGVVLAVGGARTQL